VGEAPPAEPAEPTGEEFVFGVVLVGPKNDHGWSQAHAEAAAYLEEKLPGARAVIFESLNSADKPEATLEGVVDDMVADGAKLVLTTSDEFEEDTLGVAEKYPDVVFINVSGDDALTGEAPPNLGNFMGRMEDMKAIAGCAAALNTQSGSLGYLGPLINFETRRLASSAYLGAKYCYENYRGMNPADLQFTVTWIGFWFNIPGVTLDPTEVTNASSIVGRCSDERYRRPKGSTWPGNARRKAHQSGRCLTTSRVRATSPRISAWACRTSTGALPI
jgi:simple sugar transport system substrate-binding protein